MLGPALTKILAGQGGVDALTKAGIAGFAGNEDGEAGLGNALRARLAGKEVDSDAERRFFGAGFGAGRRIDSARELEAAQRRDAMGGSPEMEALARRRGLNSYAEMRAYEMNKRNKVGGTVPGTPSDGNPTNPLSWTPRSLFDYAARKYAEATGQ